VPEAAREGPIARLLDGDSVIIDAERGELSVELDPAILDGRVAAPLELATHRFGFGRELFGLMRSNVSTAEQGACALFEESSSQ
jgi:phosphogluconate dehydratase